MQEERIEKRMFQRLILQSRKTFFLIHSYKI